jgi:UDP-N-acetylglucosamine acyltransferase
MIDSTARISPTARIAADAEIGPNVQVGDHAVVGSGTRVMANAVIGPWTTVGENNVIHFGAIVGHDPQDFGYKGEESYTVVGSGNIIREYVTIHRGNRPGTTTTVGDNNFLMIQSHVAHNCEVGNNIILAGGALLAGHVCVDDRAIISGNCVVHQFCRIGRFAMMRGLSRTSRDVPPFCIMDETHTVKSLNLVGLRRNGFDVKRVRAIKNAFAVLFRSGLNMPNAVARVEAELETTDDVRELLDFIKGSKRGVCFGRGAAAEDFE